MMEILLSVAGLYGAIGVLFSVAFVLLGAKKIDPAAAGGSWGFRVMIFPGCVALWPVLLVRWLKGGAVVERSAHRDLAAKKEGGPA